MGIDGIKKRATKKPEPERAPFLPVLETIIDNSKPAFNLEEELALFDTTSHKPKKSLGYIYLFIIAVLAIIAISFLIPQAKKTKTEIISSAVDLENKLKDLDVTTADGQLSQTADLIRDSQKFLKNSKLITQGWGQDLVVFNMVDKRKSSLSNQELLLDNIYSIYQTLEAEIQKNDKADWSNVFGQNSSGNLLNIATVQAEGLGIAESIHKSILRSVGNLESVQTEQSKFAVEKLRAIDSSLSLAIDVLQNKLTWLSGKNQNRKILIVFQNNAELRGGSGGSFGSYGIANISNGKLTKIDFGPNIFKLDNPLREVASTPTTPEVLQPLVGAKWVLKDSGWSVDGEEALTNMMAFYEREAKTSVDGIMTIDTTAFGRLLAITGPIELPAYQETIDQNNFRAILEQEVHEDYFSQPGAKQENEPKKIMSELMPLFIDRLYSNLQNQDNLVTFATAIKKSLLSKDILFNLKNDELQTTINKLGWSGAVPASANDFLYVNNSNLNGFKSSLSVKQKLGLNVTIDLNGTVSNSLDIKRTHSGTNIFPDGLNRNYVRTLVPDGSTQISFVPKVGNFQPYFNLPLINGQYFSVTKEADKTAINFWMNTETGSESETTVNYQPNYKISTSGDFNYVLNLLKQPGALSDEVELTLNYPAGFRPTNVKKYDSINRIIVLKTTLDQDQSIKIIFQKTNQKYDY